MALNRMLKDLQKGLLVSPRQEQYLSQCQGEVELSTETIAFVIDQLSHGDRDRRATFSASGRGNCLRQQMFGFLSMASEKSYSSDTAAIFIHGSWTHLKWQCMGLEAGWLAEVEVPCRIDEFAITGTIDGILDTGEGWELKSINSRGFRGVCEYGPQTKHIYQVHTYMLATGIRKWSLVYEDKDTQQWREWVINWDQGIVDELLDEFEILRVSRETHELPPVLENCLKHKGTQYTQCPFKNQCMEIDKWPMRTGIQLSKSNITSPMK